MDKKTLILGGGVSGLTMAHLLKNALVIEKNPFTGGLCHSFKMDGFTFDCTGHYLHADEKSFKRIEKYISNELLKVKRNASIFIEGKYIEYPFQSHFHSLRKRTVEECIEGYETRDAGSKASSFYDWIMKYYGSGIAHHFMLPYNEKMWKTDARKMTAEWTGRFIPSFTEREIMKGGKSSVGYNSYFYYPKEPGFENIFRFQNNSVVLNEKAVRIDARKKLLITNKNEYKYEKIISTIPLPETLKLAGLYEKRLRYSSVYNINLAVEGDAPCKWHWAYFPEKEIPFYRVGIPSNVNHRAALKGSYILSIEAAYRGRKHFEYKEILSSLKRCGLLKSEKLIKLRFDLDIKYGYTVYDRDYALMREKYISSLNEFGILTTGRYGAWKYSFAARDIADAIELAEKIKSEEK